MGALDIELSESAIDNIFGRVRNETVLRIEPGDWVKLGAMRLRVEGGLSHLAGGKFSVIDPAIGKPRGQIKELDIVWDRLDIGIGLNIPTVEIGGYCVIPKPFGGCWVRLPRKRFFKGDPDISATLSLAGIRNELSLGFEMRTRQAADSWELLLSPQRPIDIDFVDMPDLIADLIDRLVSGLVDGVLRGLPGWARDIIRGIFRGISRLVRSLLDLGDDAMEWVESKIGISLGLIDRLVSILADLYEGLDVYSVDNPLVLMDANGLDPDVSVPISGLEAAFLENPGRLKLKLSLSEGA